MAKSIKLIICLSFGILSVVLLYWLSPRINSRANGFTRLFPPHKIEYLHDRRLAGNSNYFAGLTGDHLYLGNNSDPELYNFVDYDFKIIKTEKLFFSRKKSVVPKFLMVTIDSPYVSICEGVTPIIFTGNQSNDSLYSLAGLDLHFMSSVRVSSSSWILRTYDPELKQTILLKKTFFEKSSTSTKYVLEKQQDGVFSTDGILKFDRQGNILTFVYYYKNIFVCLDTNLHELIRGRTIDTVSHAVLNIMYNNNRKVSSISGNSIQVNKLSEISGNYLFVNSGLLANNEDPVLFERASVIDLYMLKNGKYQYSFYIPYFQNEPVRNFIIKKDRLFALYDDYLVAYRLNV